MERGVLSYYLEGNLAIGLFRNWVMANWAKKLRVTVEIVQECGNRDFLTMLKTRQDRDVVLSHVHPHIRGCVVAHMQWTLDMDMVGYKPKMKPLEVEVSYLPKWAKKELPKVFLSLGPVLSFPPETQEMLQSSVMATILWDQVKSLPDSVFLSLAGCKYKCQLRKVMHKKEDDDIDDSDWEETADNHQNNGAEANQNGQELSSNIQGKSRTRKGGSSGNMARSSSDGSGGTTTNGDSSQLKEFDLNMLAGDADVTQTSRTSAADKGGDQNQMFLGVKFLQQLEYGVLLGAHNWVNDTFSQRLESIPRQATLEEVETGQEVEDFRGQSSLVPQGMPEVIMPGPGDNNEREE
ncbi:hypothetical protein R1sor_024232 [Riccia sorocarpa]|uniref:Uncharacterized protein n=1 Tax=Riccia sorocarpa TaxID=122646 RepID=A0ABD3GRG6_9MARC